MIYDTKIWSHLWYHASSYNREHYVRDNIDNTHTYKHIQILVQVLLLIQWEDDSQYESSFTLICFQFFKFRFTMGYPFFTFQFIDKL